ncbi:MAG TPA: rod shape-determining protein MreD [Mycobacteriales bacterium]|nr:rod shape-determining protein MreD [Mycobacteriales bacterium]
MRPARASLFAALLLTGAVLQVTVINRLPLPVARPDLLLVLVVACALVSGPAPGAVLGFLTGLLADTVPPADHAIGRLALVYAAVGYGAGLLDDVEERSVLLPLLLVALASVGAVALNGVVGSLTGDPRVHWPTIARELPLIALYDVVLTPFVVPLVARLTRRVDRDAVRR